MERRGGREKYVSAGFQVEGGAVRGFSAWPAVERCVEREAACGARSRGTYLTVRYPVCGHQGRLIDWRASVQSRRGF